MSKYKTASCHAERYGKRKDKQPYMLSSYIKIMAVDNPMTLIISMHAMTLMLASITTANLMTAAMSKMNIQEGWITLSCANYHPHAIWMTVKMEDVGWAWWLQWWPRGCCHCRGNSNYSSSCRKQQNWSFYTASVTISDHHTLCQDGAWVEVTKITLATEYEKILAALIVWCGMWRGRPVECERD